MEEARRIVNFGGGEEEDEEEKERENPLPSIFFLSLSQSESDARTPKVEMSSDNVPLDDPLSASALLDVRLSLPKRAR